MKAKRVQSSTCAPLTPDKTLLLEGDDISSLTGESAENFNDQHF
jgi:hypothetical protein